MADAFACSDLAAAAAEPPPPKPRAGRRLLWGASVTVRSVPMLESGSSASLRLVEPTVSAEIAITRPRRSASPSDGQDRPAFSPEELAPQVAEKKHRADQAAAPVSHLRVTTNEVR